MPLATVKLAPGVNQEITQAQGMAQITSSQLIRFKYAGNEILPEKLGGWQKFYPLSFGSVVRDLHAWEGINADTHLAIGCTASLNVLTDGVPQDVTPQTDTTNDTPSFTTVNTSNLVTIDDTNITVSEFDSVFILTPVAVGGLIIQGAYPINTVLDSDTYTILAASDANADVSAGGAVPSFTTASGSALVNVELVANGYAIGTVFPIPTPTTVGGITLSGAYLVQAITDADNFTIIASSAATSTDTVSMNGGDVSILYFIGNAPAGVSAGYGIGAYGDGGYGLGIVPPTTPGTPITATNWDLDNWGEVLIATPANGPIYIWSPDSGFPVGTKIVGAPLINGGAFVAQPAQFVIAWASSQNGVQDPLSVHWSTSGDYTDWTVSSQTQAGGYRLPTGSKIVGGCAGPNFNVLWTDVDVWSMDYIEPPLIFGFNAIATNCGLISQHGFATLNATIMWMSNNQFCRLRGEVVESVPCSVWDFVFQDLDLDNADKIHAGSNSLFNELVWYFPSLSGGTGDCDSYVKYNPLLNTWDSGRLARTAWIDQSPVGQPIGGGPQGYVYQHEVSPDADGQPMISWLETGYFEIADGEMLSFVDWILPDFKYGVEDGDNGAILQITLSFGDYPTSEPKTKGPYSVSSVTPYVNSRLRGRFVGLRIESQDLGSFWRLGALKVRSAPDGRR